MRLRNRFLLGSVLPTVLLVVGLSLLLATGIGKREAPAIVFFASLFAVPAVLLLNCWVLFIAWSSSTRIALAAAVLPGLFALGALLAIHSTGGWQQLGMAVLMPFLPVPMRHLELLAGLWAVALVIVLLWAHRIETK